jgi:hypothetical protein
MTRIAAESIVTTALRSLPRSTLMYFCVAFIGAIALTAIEQVTKPDRSPIVAPMLHTPDAPSPDEVTKPAENDDPFVNFEGTWSGRGTITLVNGDIEDIECRAVFKKEAQTLRLNLSCGSNSYVFYLDANVINENNILTGKWKEQRRNIEGKIEGHAENEKISMMLVQDATGPIAKMILKSHGNGLNLMIQNPNSGVAVFDTEMTRSASLN